MKARKQKMKAWLVTWEWVGEHARRDNKVAAVFSPRLGGGRVRELVEFLYAHEYYTVSERMDLAKGQQNPYPGQFGAIDGITWSGEVICGAHPFLRARLVDDLMVERDADGKEQATWKERPRPVFSPELKRAAGFK